MSEFNRIYFLFFSGTNYLNIYVVNISRNYKKKDSVKFLLNKIESWFGLKLIYKSHYYIPKQLSKMETCLVDITYNFD